MLLTARQPVSTAPSGGDKNSLRLQLRNDGQLIDLPLGKTTVGSSPRCNLRIDEPGVQPLHCLLVHGPEGLSVRRWAADTKLNGLAFDDAQLVAGDCLTLGGLELEVVGPLAEGMRRKTSVPAGDASAMAVSSTLSSNDAAQLSDPNSVAASIAKDRDTAPFDWGGTPAFKAVTADVAESTEEECEMLMDVVQDSFDAMNNLEDERAGAAADERFASVACEQESLTSPDIAVEDRIGEEFAIDLATADARDAELDSDEVAEASAGQATYLNDSNVNQVSIVDAAEVVFRELQAACAMSRSRSWKLLTALRNEREQKQELLARLAVAGGQLEALSAQQPDDFAVSEPQTHEDRDWEQEAQRLRRKIAAWERQVAEYAARMTELQHELAMAKAGEAATSQVFEPKRLPTVDAVEVSSGSPMPVAGDVAESAVEGPAVVTSEDIVSESYEPASGKHPFGGEQQQASEWVAPSHDVPVFGELESTAEPVPVEDANEAFGEGDTSNPFGNAPQPASWSDLVRQSQLGMSAETARNDRSATPIRSEVDEVFGDDGQSTAAAAIEVDAPAWAGKEAESSHAANHAEDDISPFTEFSIWKQGAKEEMPAPVAESDAEPPTKVESVPSLDEALTAAPAVDSPPVFVNQAPTPGPVTGKPASAISEVRESIRPASQPTSFIERYAQLFEEDQAQETPAAVPVSPAVPASTAASKPLATGIMHSEPAGGTPPSACDEEESLEDYMAKLLQRVRGGVPTTTAPVAATVSKTAAPATAVNALPKSVGPHAPAREQSQAQDSGKSEVDAEQTEIDWEAIARKAASAPKANIGALRALANQTARQAISRHALTKHRRDTVTKVIVSMLAGMTSLWLMLDAPSWYDLQCVTAGIALIGAAYWAVEAYQELTAAWRVAAVYEALHADDEAVVTLPIDVEGR